MEVLVPFAAREPKTRLREALDSEERAAFARAMLLDVCDAVRGAGHDPTVLASGPIEAGETTAGFDDPLPPVVVDDRPLTTAVQARLDPPVAVVMADLALATPAAVSRLFGDVDATAREGTVEPDPDGESDADGGSDADGVALADARTDVVVAPGLGAGTNALVVGHRDFRVDFHGTSYRDHLAIAREVAASIRTVDSFRLAVDVDEPDDLREVLLHSDGRAAAWLRDAGFRLRTPGGRVRARRDE